MRRKKGSTGAQRRGDEKSRDNRERQRERERPGAKRKRQIRGMAKERIGKYGLRTEAVRAAMRCSGGCGSGKVQNTEKWGKGTKRTFWERARQKQVHADPSHRKFTSYGLGN